MSEVPTELQELDAPQYATLQVEKQRPTLGPVRVDATAFAASVVLLIFAYLAWLAGIVAPPDIIASTTAVIGTGAGIIFPNDASSSV